MIDKQQLQEMGLHLSEQQAKGIADGFAEIDYAWELPPTQEGGLRMARQIEDLQARLQECANGAAKMQEQRDCALSRLSTATSTIYEVGRVISELVKNGGGTFELEDLLAEVNYCIGRICEVGK